MMTLNCCGVTVILYPKVRVQDQGQSARIWMGMGCVI